MFDPSRADEVVADHSAASRLHLRVGSVLHLLVNPSTGSGPVDPNGAQARPLTVHVVGVGVTRDNVVPVTAFSSGSSLLVTPALLNGLSPAFYNYDAAFVRLEPGKSFPAFARDAEALLPAHPETGGPLNMIDERQSTTKVERAIRPEAVTLALFALLVALTALIVVGQILVRQLSATSAIRRRLRALGMTRAQLAAIEMAEVGGTVLLAAAIGSAGAIALSALMPIGPARLAEPDPGWPSTGSSWVSAPLRSRQRSSPPFPPPWPSPKPSRRHRPVWPFDFGLPRSCAGTDPTLLLGANDPGVA